MTVQGPVKEQQPDGMSHRGGGGACHRSRHGQWAGASEDQHQGPRDTEAAAVPQAEDRCCPGGCGLRPSGSVCVCVCGAGRPITLLDGRSNPLKLPHYYAKGVGVDMGLRAGIVVCTYNVDGNMDRALCQYKAVDGVSLPWSPWHRCGLRRLQLQVYPEGTPHKCRAWGLHV